MKLLETVEAPLAVNMVRLSLEILSDLLLLCCDRILTVIVFLLGFILIGILTVFIIISLLLLLLDSRLSFLLLSGIRSASTLVDVVSRTHRLLILVRDI